jgi:hypothetical protein
VKDFTTAQTQLQDIMTKLQQNLVNRQGAILQDDSAYKFRYYYGQGLGSLLQGIVRIHSLFGNIGNALYTAAQNHHNADSGSQKGDIPDLPPPAPPIAAPGDGDLPNIANGDTDGVSAKVLQYWPWCHLEKIHDIVTAYNDVAQDLETQLKGLYDNFQKATQGNASEDLSQFASYFNPIARPALVSDLPNLARDLSTAVQGYSDLVFSSIEPFKAAAHTAWEDLSTWWHVEWTSQDGRELLINGSTWFSQDEIGQKALDENTIKDRSRDLVIAVTNAEWITKLAGMREEVDGVIKNLKDPGAATSDATQPNDPKPKGTSPPPYTGGHTPGPGALGSGSLGSGSLGSGSLGAGSKADDPGKSGDDPGKKPGDDTGNISPSPILDDGQAKRAKEQLDKLSAADRQRMQQLLDGTKSIEERDYLLKDLAAGHTVDDVSQFDALIHDHGDDAAWLQSHLTPMPNSDAQHPDFTYQGGSWSQGKYPASVAASTILARAMTDPSYTLNLTTGNKPDDPAFTSKDAFLQRLHDEQQRVYDQGQGDGGTDPGTGSGTDPGVGGTDPGTLDPTANGGNPIGTDGGGAPQAPNADVGAYNGQSYQHTDVRAGPAELANVLPGVENAVAEGNPVPIQVDSGGNTQQMAVVGHNDNQLQIYHPPGDTTWVSKDDFVNGRLAGVSDGEPLKILRVSIPSSELISA